jgi:hypothetical protein
VPRETADSVTTRLHMFIALAFAVPGIGILLYLLAAMVMDPESLAILALLLSAPIWLAGLVAAAESVRLLRGGAVTRRRALVWACAALIGGFVLAHFTGLLRLAIALLARPGDVGLGWPATTLIENGATYYLHLDQPAPWLALLWIVLGGVALLAAVRGDSRRRLSRV